MLAKLLAGILGLMAFFLCITGGLVAGARVEVAIGRGLQAMLIFCLLGWVIGWIAESAIHEQVRKEAQEMLAEMDKAEQAVAAEPTNGQAAKAESQT